jgi:hypothetical protein
MQLLITMYSAGIDLPSIREAFPAVVGALASYLQEPYHETFDFTRLDSYIHALWLSALSILLDVDQANREAVIDLIGSPHEDRIFDRLVSLQRYDISMTNQLLHPRPYEYLSLALDANEPQHRDQHIGRFLHGWYRGMRHAYWYNSHLLEDGGYFGYWCFELAAFAKALLIPDESFRNNVYYPVDLVHTR